MPVFIIFLVIAGLAILVGYFFSRRALRRNTIAELSLKLFSVRLSKEAVDGVDFKNEIRRSEQLISALAAFKTPFVFEVAVHSVGEDIHFYIAVPGSQSDAMVRQVHSLWNDARIEPVSDYNIFNYGGTTLGAFVRQKRGGSLPIRTYEEMDGDTFLPILGGLTKVREVGEGGALQFIVRPASKRAKEVKAKLADLKKGGKITGNDSVIPSLSEIASAAAGSKGQGKGGDAGKPDAVSIDQASVTAVEKKLAKPLFEVNVRLIASAANQFQAESILDGLTAGFSQFGAPDRNELTVTRPRNIRQLTHQFSFREFSEDQIMLLTSEEAASMFHLPTPMTDIPRVRFLSFKEAPPPSNLPKEGVILGENHFRGGAYEMRISPQDRQRHLYIIGQTGTGKSVLLSNLAGQDIVSGGGICLIDPNGDLFTDVLGRVPKRRIKDLIIFDPSDLDRPLGLNMLEYDPRYPEHKTFIVNELLMIFNTLYDMKTAGGPMFEQYMRNALLLLMDDPADGFTLLEVPRVLSDAAFRKRLLAKCGNIVTKDFWEKEAEKAGGEASLQNMVPYITSKFNTFLANDYVRPIIAQSKSSLNFRQVLDEGKILLVNLSKGRIGDLNASLLGMIIVGKLTIAAFSRADVPMESRRDFQLFIDEFQNFTTPSIATILSEARKYRLCLTVAHQFVGQLSDEIKKAVFGNVGSMIAFRVGADDAEFLAKQFEPVFSGEDLMNIDNLNAHVKLTIGGQTAPPSTLFVPFPERGDPEIVRLGREYSRLTYGRNRMEIEDETYKKLRS